MRDLLDNVQYAPSRGRFKIYLIDEVHMLSKSSFAALLKTLEEPPAHGHAEEQVVLQDELVEEAEHDLLHPRQLAEL